MASEKILNSKKEAVKALNEKLIGSASGVILDYKGINVADDTKFRAQARAAGVDYAVIKNSLIRFAIEGTQLADLSEHLAGTTAVAVCKDDAIAAAKVVAEFAKTNENIKIKGGYYDGKVVDADTVKALAKIPPKDTLIAQMLGCLNFPITGLAIALKAIAEQKEAEAV